MAIVRLINSYREKPYRNIFVAIFVIILLDALTPNALLRGLVADLMLAAVLLAALVETVRTRRHSIWALGLGLPAICARVLAAFRPDSMVQNSTVLGLNALFLAFLIWNLLHDLNGRGRSTSERVFGALCVYVFIGLFFALVYTHIEYRQPGSFTFSGDTFSEVGANEVNTFPIFTFFSFVTLTTLGYGDVTPVVEHARTLAWFEALTGQLFLVVMVAGLVSKHISEGIGVKGSDNTAPRGEDGDE